MLEEYRWRGHYAGTRNMALACCKKFVRIMERGQGLPFRLSFFSYAVRAYIRMLIAKS